MNRALVAIVLFACAGAAAAQAATLSDPTRPPSMKADAAGESAAPTGPRLQSVLISPARRIAVISGKAVTLGDKYGDATIDSITEGAVLLRYADRRETLRLIPGVEKRERRVADAAASDKGMPR